MARPTNPQPTEAELDVLRVLWRLGPSELGAVRAGLRATRPIATTTIATMLKLMREKGLVDRADGPKGYVWSAAVGERATRDGLLRRLLNQAFDGSARRLVAHLIEDHKLGDADREAIRRLFDEDDAPATPATKPTDRRERGSNS